MLKVVLLIAAFVAALALTAPEYLSRFSGERDTAKAAAREQEQTPTRDHGGIVRVPANRGGQYVSEIEVNDRPITAMVDTGATLVALRYEDARTLGLIFPGDKFDVVTHTANGQGRAKRVRLRSVTFGTITIRDVDAIILEQGALGTNLLGMSFLRRLSRFEVQRGTLVLER